MEPYHGATFGATAVTADELETLTPSDVQRLIELCEANHSYRWSEALKLLYDKRHELRQAAMETLRQVLGKMPPEVQLLHLVRNPLTPIEHFPVELAQYVTPNWLETLDLEEKARSMELLRRTRLRAWKRRLPIMPMSPL